MTTNLNASPVPNNFIVHFPSELVAPSSIPVTASDADVNLTGSDADVAIET